MGQLGLVSCEEQAVVDSGAAKIESNFRCANDLAAGVGFAVALDINSFEW